MKTYLAYHNTFLIDNSELMALDIWQAEHIGLKPDTVNCIYQLNFTSINSTWLKIALKQFIHFQAATKSFASCFSYLGKLKYFSAFLEESFSGIMPYQIDRAVVVKFIAYLAKGNLSEITRNITLIHLRTFQELSLQEKWLPFSPEPFIFSSDLIKLSQHIPKFIPEMVISQLQQHLCHLPLFLQYLITILLETGRRINEVCMLPFHCLEQDNQGDYFLKVNDKKLKKSYLLPISDACIKAIQAQQQFVLQSNFVNKSYLFVSPRTHKAPHITARAVNKALNELAMNNRIVDNNNERWQFHTHQFRHTVGTRMINSGVPQTMVQKYLGHESPEMTSRYAHIHDETLKAAFNDYQEKLVDITGKIYQANDQSEYEDAKWLKHNIMSQALPNGLCALPSPQQRCPHANACLTCVNFRTSKEHLPLHQNQLKATNNIIDTAEKNGWQRQLEMNLSVKNNLEKIITSLKEK